MAKYGSVAGAYRSAAKFRVQNCFSELFYPNGQPTPFFAIAQKNLGITGGTGMKGRYGSIVGTYASAARLRVDNAFSEFYYPNGQPTPLLAVAQKNLGIGGGLDPTSSTFSDPVQNLTVNKSPGDAQIVQYPNLTEITNGATLTLGGDSTTPSLVSARFPKLALISGTPPPYASLFMTGSQEQTDVQLPALAVISGESNLIIDRNPLLTDIELPALTRIDNAWVELTGNALTQACVNALLVKFAAATKIAGGSLDMSGGANAAPSGAGITAKNALIAAGWSVTTN